MATVSRHARYAMTHRWTACRVPARSPHLQQLKRRAFSTPGFNDPNPTPDPSQQQQQNDDENTFKGRWGPTLFKMFENAATTFASITILGLVGYGYTRYYKYLVLQKIEGAFKPGDPALEIAGRGKGPGSEPDWIHRDEQDLINSIIDGNQPGRYFLLIGEKGTGKSSMILEAMQRIDGKGISVVDAHPNTEIFRLRLGKALDFEFHEDNIGSLFSIRGPRDASALLDIERAFNKFDKVAMKHRNAGGKPLIIVINNTHMIRDDDDGRDLLELLQQRAEQWCASGLCTVLLNSDDYWVYERLKRHATRMNVVQVSDLPKVRATEALRKLRRNYFGENPPQSVLEDVYHKVGGRLAFLTRVAKERDMMATCDLICAQEKTWFLSQCGILGEEMDDDVMDQQKYASAAMVLARALVDKAKDMKTFDEVEGYRLPTLPLHEARQVMTRADFIQAYDSINLFTITAKALVRADSVPMQRAFEEICSEKGFDEYLEATLDRISAIESLGRTRELTIKDLWNKGKYRMSVSDARDRLEKNIVFEVEAKDDDDDEAAEDGK